jgi:hypothetical protein
MRAHPALLLVALGLLACHEQSGFTQLAGGSPLADMEDDRLWILLQAARVNSRCGAYYATPEDPFVAGLAAKCEAFEARAVRWFSANDVPINVEDFRDSSLWNRYAKMVDDIGLCRQRVRREASGPMSQQIIDSAACDPYKRIIDVERKTLADVGLSEPRS